MPFPSVKVISSIPDKELSSLDQINLQAVVRAMSKVPTYTAYKTLLAHRRTLKHLQTNVDLQQEQANTELSAAMENIHKTEQIIADANNSPHPPDSTTPPSFAIGIPPIILELQKLLYAEKCATLGQCSFELGRVDWLVREVNLKIREMEMALVKEYGVRTVDDEGMLLKRCDLERAVDAAAKVLGDEIE